MRDGALPNGEGSNSFDLDRSTSTRYTEEDIYRYFLQLVRTTSPELAIAEFKKLFIEFFEEDKNSAAWNALFRTLYANDEEQFHKVLNRCCYILVNNWQSERKTGAIQNLLESFEDPTINYSTSSMSLQRLREWLKNFCQSQDYKELELFVSRNDDGPWSHRYSSYLLTHQYVFGKSKEQKEAAKALSRQIKDRFKFDLAMYTARSQSALYRPEKDSHKNPTSLGDDVLRLIKTVVAKRGPYNYINLANIFLKQTEGSTYREFKISFQKYLIFSVDNRGFVETINTKLSERVFALNKEFNKEILTPTLLRRTCKKVIEYMTTENGKEPSLLFILLLANGNPLTLALVLLKIVLICKPSYPHLEACLANLIRYYEDRSQTECKWLIEFLEVVRITFAIYADNVEYNVVHFNQTNSQDRSNSKEINYRIFSSVKAQKKEIEDEDDDDSNSLQDSFSSQDTSDE